MGAMAQSRYETGEWSVTLLGRFEVQYDDEGVDLPSDAQRLVAFLALQNGRVPRAYVAGSLWLDGSQERAFGNLRSALWRLRTYTTGLIDADNRTLGLSHEIQVDITTLVEMADRLTVPEFTYQGNGIDPARFTQELLPGWYEEWTVVHRERLRQRFLHALESLAEQLTARGDYATAIQAALAAIELDPLRESPRRCLLRTHIAEGNYSEAITHYRRYRDHLDAELGLTPSPLLEAIVSEVTL